MTLALYGKSRRRAAVLVVALLVVAAAGAFGILSGGGSQGALANDSEAPLTVTKTNNVGGLVAPGESFVWTFTIEYTGTDSKTIHSINAGAANLFFHDSLPGNALYEFIDGFSSTEFRELLPRADQSGSRLLQCFLREVGSALPYVECYTTYGGGLLLEPGKIIAFDVIVTPSISSGELANPRPSPPGCAVDPGNVLTPAHPDKSCADTVLVSDAPPPSDPTITVRKMVWDTDAAAWVADTTVIDWGFELDGQAITADEPQTVSPGDHTVSEAAPSGWYRAGWRTTAEEACPATPPGGFESAEGPASIDLAVETGDDILVCAYNADIAAAGASATAGGEYVLTYEWQLAKEVLGGAQHDLVYPATGETTYRISLERSDVASEWVFDATVTLSNPNVFDVAVTASAEVLDGDTLVATLSIDCPGQDGPEFVVAAGSALNCTASGMAPHDDRPLSLTAKIALLTATHAGSGDSIPAGGPHQAALTVDATVTNPEHETIDVSDADDYGHEDLWIDRGETGSGTITYSRTFECSPDGFDLHGSAYSYDVENIATAAHDASISDTAKVGVNCSLPDATLTLRKLVVGGSVPADGWSLAASDDGQMLVEGSGAGDGVSGTVAPGTPIELSESVVTTNVSALSYVLTSMVCVEDGSAEIVLDWPAENAQPSFEMPAFDVTCTFANTYLPATVVVQKLFSPEDDGGAVGLRIEHLASPPTIAFATRGHGGEFSLERFAGLFQVSEDDAGATQVDWYDASLTCTSSDAARDDLPAGAATKESEPFHVEHGETVTCVFTNERKTASVTVEKATLDALGEPVESDDAFSFEGDGEPFVLDTDADTATPASRTFVADVGSAFAVAEDLAAGSLGEAWLNTALVCEPADASLEVDVNYGGAAEAGRSASFAVPKDGITCTFTNQQRLGSVRVEKVLDWNGAPESFAQFSICLEGPAPSTETDCQQLGVEGGTLHWHDVVPGEYTVIEDDPGAAWSTSYNGQQVTVLPGQHVDETVVTNTRNRGSLSVTKAVDWGDVEADESTFTICIDGASFPVVDQARTEPADFAPDACRDFPEGDSLVVTWDGLIEGAYTVTEIGVDTSLWAVSNSGVTVSVEPGGEHSHTVTNTRLTGSLVVAKTVDARGGEAGDWQFEICITGPLPSTGESCEPVDASKPAATWDVLDPGDYDVLERYPDGDEAAWDTIIDSGDEANPQRVTVAADATATAGVTNTLLPGRVAVLKLYPASCDEPLPADWPAIYIGGEQMDGDGCRWPDVDAGFVDVPANVAVDIREVLPAGWAFAGVEEASGECALEPAEFGDWGFEAPAPADVVAGSVRVAPGEECVVAIRNEPVGTVQVTKASTVALDEDKDWALVFDPVGELVLTTPANPDGEFVAESVTFYNIPAGAYAIQKPNGADTCDTSSSPDEYQTLAGAGIGIEPAPGELDVVGSAPVDTVVEPGETTFVVYVSEDCASVLSGWNLFVRVFQSDNGGYSASGPLQGWVITITGSGLADGFQSALTTDDAGMAGFGFIPAGVYTICQQPQTRFITIGSNGNDGHGEVPGDCRQGVEVYEDLERPDGILIDFFNQPAATDPGDTTPTPTPTPAGTDPTATPTATQTPGASDTPTPTPAAETPDPSNPTVTATPTPVEAVAGEMTPGPGLGSPTATAPGSEATPAPPATGTGASGSKAPALALLLAAAIAAGATLLARRTN